MGDHRGNSADDGSCHPCCLLCRPPRCPCRLLWSHAGVYSGLNSVYGHYYGKREAAAEPEAEADPLVYTTGVHAPVVSTYSHGVVAAPAVSSVISPVVRTVASPVVSRVVSPVVRTVAPVVSHVATPAVYSGVYSGVYGHYYGKREAEAEPEAEADPLVYTTGVHTPVVSTYSDGVVAAPAVSSVVSPVV